VDGKVAREMGELQYIYHRVNNSDIDILQVYGGEYKEESGAG
jgi:hypothetical protein